MTAAMNPLSSSAEPTVTTPAWVDREAFPVRSRVLEVTPGRRVHYVDEGHGDVILFVQGAIASPQFPWAPATQVRGAVLDAVCSWRELEVEAIDETPPRSRIETRVVHRGFRREFIGFNRARHAVLEAAILATRTHLIPADEIRADYARLQVIVDKTAGPREREAMATLTEYVRSR